MESNTFSNKNITDNKNDLITIEPNKIYLYKLNDQISVKSTDQNIYEGRIIMKNNSNNFLVFEFHLNNYNSIIYSITPNIYFINPKGTINVNFKKFDKVIEFNILSLFYISLH